MLGPAQAERSGGGSGPGITRGTTAQQWWMPAFRQYGGFTDAGSHEHVEQRSTGVLATGVVVVVAGAALGPHAPRETSATARANER